MSEEFLNQPILPVKEKCPECAGRGIVFAGRDPVGGFDRMITCATCLGKCRVTAPAESAATAASSLPPPTRPAPPMPAVKPMKPAQRLIISKWKSGNEWLPFHPQASHITPGYRSGWNDAYDAAHMYKVGAEVANIRIDCTTQSVIVPYGWDLDSNCLVQPNGRKWLPQEFVSSSNAAATADAAKNEELIEKLSLLVVQLARDLGKARYGHYLPNKAMAYLVTTDWGKQYFPDWQPVGTPRADQTDTGDA